MNQTIIEVRDLRKVFGATVAVDGISFTVTKGEILGFLGPNGAGKTTTIGMLLGLLTPTAGDIRIFGMPMPQQRQEILARANFSKVLWWFPLPHIFENMRSVFAGQGLNLQHLAWAFGLNVAYLVAAFAFFRVMFERARAKGFLMKMQE